MLAAMVCPSVAPAATETFNYSPQTQSWIAPPHVTSATFDVYGAQGGSSIYFPDASGGLGGRATATIDVVPNHEYWISVGGQGYDTPDIDPTKYVIKGGGGSEVRSRATLLSSTRLIAAGGGGAGPAGVPGGTEDAAGGSINGSGAGGASWGPPGTKYEVGVRAGNGLVTVTYDAFPQNTVIESGPDGLTNDNTPTFSFDSNEAGVSFQCFDEFTFGTCSGPGQTHTSEPLADGPHKIAVTSTDGDGFTDPTPATRTFTVDTKAPVIRVTDRPKDTVKTDGKRVRVRVRFKSAEPETTFECRLDKGAYRQCGSPYSVRVKAKPGRGAKHRISVRGTDAAGNKTPVSVKFRAIRKG